MKNNFQDKTWYKTAVVITGFTMFTANQLLKILKMIGLGVYLVGFALPINLINAKRNTAISSSKNN